MQDKKVSGTGYFILAIVMFVIANSLTDYIERVY